LAKFANDIGIRLTPYIDIDAPSPRFSAPVRVFLDIIIFHSILLMYQIFEIIVQIVQPKDILTIIPIIVLASFRIPITIITSIYVTRLLIYDGKVRFYPKGSIFLAIILFITIPFTKDLIEILKLLSYLPDEVVLLILALNDLNEEAALYWAASLIVFFGALIIISIKDFRGREKIEEVNDEA